MMADYSANGSGKARVFQGGTYMDLHRMLGVTSGSQVLYVGEHCPTTAAGARPHCVECRACLLFTPHITSSIAGSLCCTSVTPSSFARQVTTSSATS